MSYKSIISIFIFHNFHYLSNDVPRTLQNGIIELLLCVFMPPTISKIFSSRTIFLLFTQTKLSSLNKNTFSEKLYGNKGWMGEWIERGSLGCGGKR